MRGRSVSFDAQAPSFDLRAGIPEQVQRTVAAAVVSVAGLAPGSLLVDLGAGTGVIGYDLAMAGLVYRGIDQSSPMLDRFRARLGSLASAELMVADASDRWPLAPGSARAVFASRSVHWLDAEHVASEVERVASPEGCCLLIGRIERDEGSVQAVLRRELHRLLRAQGLAPRDGRRASSAVQEALVRRGAQLVQSRPVAEWEVVQRPHDALEAWRGKEGLAGVDARDVGAAVLDELERWTRAHWSPIDAPRTSRERYVIGGASFPARSRSA